MQAADLDDEDKKQHPDHPNQVTTHRKFTTETYEQLFKIYMDTSRNNISPSFFVLKPFYVGPATVQEMISCVCIDCLNPHNIYNDIRRLLTKNKSRTLHALNCIDGKCANSCQVTNVKTDLKRLMEHSVKRSTSG